MRVGTAGWSIPAAVRDAFPDEGSTLTRYAAVFDTVEINSSSYRPHRAATYARWAASVPDAFRFAVKLPRAATHDLRLVDCDEVLARFQGEMAGLGAKRGPVLVQLPPSLAFDGATAGRFFDAAARMLGEYIVCEPRHASWFAPEADALFAAHHVARVAADPARVPEAALPGGWRGLTYARWHGSPAIYRSAYEDDALAQHAGIARAADDSWTFYDNTMFGAAAANALALKARLDA
ncbi:DUF72 domain-containing protein [Sphingomonas sp.]|uniref:DUF72 domain-containing protein n=1 Tax=Sphingomonas sp. TaxID=28214 RepID=UPI003CC62AF2